MVVDLTAAKQSKGSHPVGTAGNGTSIEWQLARFPNHLTVATVKLYTIQYNLLSHILQTPIHDHSPC